MKNRVEIQDKYLVLHDALGTRTDAEDKELFDQQHAEVWANCEVELRARKAYLESISTPTLEKQAELAILESMYPTPSEPTPEAIRAKEIIEGNPQSIPATEAWELLKIIVDRLFS